MEVSVDSVSDFVLSIAGFEMDVSGGKLQTLEKDLL